MLNSYPIVESLAKVPIPSQSELFRFIPISVSELMEIIPNQSEKRFVSRLMKKRSQINPNEAEPIRNQVFSPDQSESIRARIDLNQIFNQNQSE